MRTNPVTLTVQKKNQNATKHRLGKTLIVQSLYFCGGEETVKYIFVWRGKENMSSVKTEWRQGTIVGYYT